MAGQINLGTQFGNEIYNICMRDDVNVCVDVGAWNGLGSTKCIVQALENKKKGHVFSFEIDNGMYAMASQIWSGNPYITLSKSRLATSMMTIDEVKNHPNYSNISSQNWMDWYAGELANFDSSDVGDLPDAIDFVIIDGGEFSGSGDWNAVKDKNPKYVALDDIFTVKTSHIIDDLISSGVWDIKSQGNDRNGWIILQRKE
jgi:hypothetical protein